MSIRPFDPDRELWERQKGESLTNYSLFTEFLRGAPSDRNIKGFAEKRSLNMLTVRNAATKWRWTERVAAYEADIDKQALKASGAHNRKAAAELSSVMTLIPQAAEKALRLGLAVIERYADEGINIEDDDDDGRTFVRNRLHAKDAIGLMTAANNLLSGLGRYLEGAGTLQRSLNVNVTGRVEHAITAPDRDDLIRFVGALHEAGQMDAPRRDYLEARIIEEMGEPLALESGDGYDDDGEPDEALPIGRHDQPLSMEADT